MLITNASIQVSNFSLTKYRLEQVKNLLSSLDVDTLTMFMAPMPTGTFAVQSRKVQCTYNNASIQVSKFSVHASFRKSQEFVIFIRC